MKMRHIILGAAVFGLFITAVPAETWAAQGWQQVDGSWYYYETGSHKTGWLKKDGNTYYLSADGKMAKGWQQIDQKWYLFREDGSMHTGWWLDGSTWYYLTLDGSMLKDGYGPDGHWMNSDGAWNAEVRHELGISRNTGDSWEPDRQRLKYQINWETDVDAYGVGSGQLDAAITFALLGRAGVDILNEKERQVYDVIKKFIQDEIKDDDSDYDKVKKITLFMWKNIQYKATEGGGAHEALINGNAVCAGYARTFKIMANAVGLECYHVAGSNHAWNIIRIDGDWYHADSTESLNGRDESHLYLLLANDAEWAFSKGIYPSSFVTYPMCTATEYTRTNMK